MGWRSINDPFCGHSCSDGVMVPQKKAQLPHRWYLDPWRPPGIVDVVEEIVIDANMDLKCPDGLSLMPPSITYNALDPLQSGFVT